MSKRTFTALVVLFSTASIAEAQTAVKATDPVFVRAQAMVSDGNGPAGRALIDSVIAATPPVAPLYPQALFWRASLAASAADAESDYKHIVVDYPLAPQAADALLRLAQLELARGDRDGALAHLQRIPRDYPRSKSLARASYWTARVLFEKNDISHACAANETARAQADTTEIELRNQIQYQGQRCPSPGSAASVAAPTMVPTITATPPTTPVSPAPSPTLPAPPAAIPVAAGSPPSAPLPASAQAKTELPAKTATQPSRPRPTEANDVKPSIVDPSKAPKAASSASGYSVQVAAYNHRADADKLVATLKGRGYAARVDGTVTPFRVRIGRYATENDAEDALKRLKAKRMDGFVVKAPQP